MDFTIDVYRRLLEAYLDAGYEFQTFEDYLIKPRSKVVILRHDVDLRPKNSLLFAQIQAEYGICGSYYFRDVPESWDEKIIKDVHMLGHEVGYHYETMDTASGNYEAAYNEFQSVLERLRKIVPVSTICMHGSPKSKFDNRDIWKKYKYQDSDIIGEPYYDVDFDNMFYLTDTGRRWDGWKVSVRDKVPQQEGWNKAGLSFHTTHDIVKAISNGNTKSGAEFPSKVMMTFHPQRWYNIGAHWAKELIMQRTKNVVKRLIYIK